MHTRKHVKKAVVQGYTGGQLETDLGKLATLRVKPDDPKRGFEYSGDVEDLIVGKACKAVTDAVDASLTQLFAKLKKLLPAKVVDAEVQYKMGPLKKIARISEKAAHYAVCDAANHAKPQLQQVRDILRATMVFPPGAWGAKEDQIGAKMIDAIDEHFGKNVVQVKNRFIHGRYPNFTGLDGVNLPNDLKTFVANTFKSTLWGRDSFYRDLQLLIVIKKDPFENGQGMDHTILELQLASSLMYAGKTQKKHGGSGHDMYKNVRRVMEYCEYLWWKKKHGGVNLPDAVRYYEVGGINFPDFAKQTEDMAKLYQKKNVDWMELTLANAIDDSAWFKRQPN